MHTPGRSGKSKSMGSASPVKFFLCLKYTAPGPGIQAHPAIKKAIPMARDCKNGIKKSPSGICKHRDGDVVEHRRFELLTPTLPVWCATSCANAPRTGSSLAQNCGFVKGFFHFSANFVSFLPFFFLFFFLFSFLYAVTAPGAPRPPARGWRHDRGMRRRPDARRPGIRYCPPAP